MRALWISALLLDPTAAEAQQADEAATIALKRRYLACTDLTETDPAKAMAEARAWLAEDAHPAARHCLAQAQALLGDYQAAAQGFADLAEQVATGVPLLEPLDEGSPAHRRLEASLWGQAGHARLLQRQPAEAAEALSQALAALPQGETGRRLELLVDRARAFGAQKQYRPALADLDDAHLLDPDRLDVLLLRATARRHLGQIGPGLDDINTVLAGQPSWGAALLERGNLRALSGDEAGARSDWLNVLRFDPNSPAAVTAQKNLAILDEEIDGP